MGSRSFGITMNGGLLLVSLLFLHTFADAAEWNYDNKNWQDGVCNTGKKQSPIDIKDQDLTVKDGIKPFIFHGFDSTFKKTTLENNGHSVKMSIESFNKAQSPPGVSGGGLNGKYTFLQYHMHWGANSQKGSEHVVNSKAYPMELHLVHQNEEKNGLAVLGIFFQIQDEDNEKLKPLIDAVKGVPEPNNEKEIKAMELKDFLPRNTDQFYRYEGSLTTPGCDEIVTWTVFKEPIGISERQMQIIRNTYFGPKTQGKRMKDNFRDSQPLNGRQVLDVDTSVKKYSSLQGCNSGASSIGLGMSLIILLVSRFLFH